MSSSDQQQSKKAGNNNLKEHIESKDRPQHSKKKLQPRTEAVAISKRIDKIEKEFEFEFPLVTRSKSDLEIGKRRLKLESDYEFIIFDQNLIKMKNSHSTTSTSKISTFSSSSKNIRKLKGLMDSQEKLWNRSPGSSLSLALVSPALPRKTQRQQKIISSKSTENMTNEFSKISQAQRKNHATYRENLKASAKSQNIVSLQLKKQEIIRTRNLTW